MEIGFICDVECDEEYLTKDFLQQIALKTFGILGVDDYEKLEINLCLTDEDKIKELNKEYRGIDKATDVLSFQMVDFKKTAIIPEEYDRIPVVVLGDIIICLPIAIKQAKEYNHSVKREISFLFVHGLLHLLGFDHINDEDRIIMEDKQDEILLALDIKR